jgi:hypothetical protein
LGYGGSTSTLFLITSRLLVGAAISWLYLHLSLTISITAVGAAVLNMVEHADDELSGDCAGC